MTDKVQKIREEVVRIHKLLPVMDGDNISVNYADRICTTLEMYIDTLQEEPVSEDLGEYISELSKQFPEVSFAKLSRIAVRVANWQKQQMMAKAVDIEVKEDAGGYPYIPQIELYDYDNDVPLAKAREKVKVIVIKED